jgi:catechol 2,3-dioxygenase-like lactoylglutathione lyase family enzyme
VKVTQVVPILNVSDVEASFAWFATLGWQRTFAWRGPGSEVTDFGGVGCDGYEIFLCRDGQGSRGRGANERTGGPGADQRADKGAWVAIWVDDVDAVHERCLAEGLEVTFPPTDEPWGVREMHVRHPDGHVFRISMESG